MQDEPLAAMEADPGAWTTPGNTDSPLATFVLGGPRPPDRLLRLSEQLRSSWISFATTGDPGWPEFTPDRSLTRIWNSEPTVAANPLAASRQIWQGLSHR